MSKIELLIYLPQIRSSHRVPHHNGQLHSSSCSSQKHSVFLDFCLSLHPLLNPLVNPICFTLKDIQIFSISPHLTFSTATTQVQAAVISHPHYCKCFLISLSLCTCPYLPHEQSTMISLTLSPPFLPLFAYWPVMLLCEGHCTCFPFVCSALLATPPSYLDGSFSCLLYVFFQILPSQ